MNHSEEIELFRKSRLITVVNSSGTTRTKSLTKRNHSEDDIVLSVLKTPLVKNTSPFRRIFSSVEEHVDRQPEEEPFNPSNVSIVFFAIHVDSTRCSHSTPNE